MHYTRWLRHGDPLKKINKRIPSICAVPDCRNMSRTRDWCRKHYLAWLRHGDPETQVQFSTPEESFLARTERVGDCLIWTGYTNPKGYGQIQVNGKLQMTHRYAWERHNGTIPDGMKIDHKLHCDPACCNPKHLRLATDAQNNYHRSGAQANSTSGIRNVRWDKANKKWSVAIQKAGKNHWFGRFSDLEEAKQVAKEARLNLFGDYAGRS